MFITNFPEHNIASSEVLWPSVMASLICLFFDNVNMMGISALREQILALETMGGCKLSNISPWEATLTTGRITRKTTASTLTGIEEHH